MPDTDFSEFEEMTSTNHSAITVLVRFIAVCSAVMALSLPAWGQTTGSISGTVTDQSQAVLPGVEVTVRNVNTGLTRTTVTDDEGRYRAPALSLGTYEILAELPGFQRALQRNVTVNLNEESVVQIVMTIGAITEEIVVMGRGVQVNTTSATITNLVEQTQIDDLPLNGRSYGDLVTLDAGVTSFKNTLSSSGTGTDFGGTGVRLVVAGLRPELGNILVDGVDAVDAFGNAPGSAAGVLLGIDTLQEFEVLSSNYSAEFGRSAGGTINVVTRSGTNQFHGSAFWYLRNDNLDARNFFDVDKPEFKRNQFGFTMGGPISHDRTFFFVGYEGLRDRLGATLRPKTITQAGREGITLDPDEVVNENTKPFFDLFPLPNGKEFSNPLTGEPDGTGEYIFTANRPTDEDFFVIKIDHQFNEDHSLFGRYSLDDAETPGLPTGLPPFRVGRESRQQLAAISHTAVVTNRLLSTFRFGYNRSTQIAPEEPVDGIFPELSFFVGDSRGVGCINVLGVVIAGCLGSVGKTVPDQFQLNEDIIYSAGDHGLKFGAVFKRFLYDDSRTFQPGGSFNFEGLNNFLLGRPVSFVGDTTNSNYFTDQRFSVFGAYLQDDWQLNGRLTMNLGLRWEVMSTPHVDSGAAIINFRGAVGSSIESFSSDRPIQNPGKKNLAPRIGLAWDPFGDGKTSIRSGFGLFFQQLNEANLNFVFRLSQNEGRTKTVLLGGPAPSMVYPKFPEPADFRPAIVFPLEYEAKQPYTIQWNFTIQQELAPGWVVQAAYLGNRGVHLARPTEVNFNQRCGDHPVASGNPAMCPGDTLFPVGGPPIRELNRPIHGADVTALSAFNLRDFGGNSVYHGFSGSVRKRFDSGYSFQISYTVSKNIDDTPPILRDFENSPTILFDWQNPQLDRSLSGFDVRQNFVANFTWQLPIGADANWFFQGWQANGIVSLAEGNPFTVVNSFDRTRTFAIGPFRHDRPNLIAGGNHNPTQNGTPDQWFDPGQFELQDVGKLGDLGRNTAIGPGLANVDLSLFKTTSLSEEMDFQFRFEVFNLFNRANFGTPGGNERVLFRSPTVLSGDAGRLTTTVTTARQIQFAFKFLF